jgi:hypothetical protein
MSDVAAVLRLGASMYGTVCVCVCVCVYIYIVYLSLTNVLLECFRNSVSQYYLSNWIYW